MIEVYVISVNGKGRDEVLVSDRYDTRHAIIALAAHFDVQPKNIELIHKQPNDIHSTVNMVELDDGGIWVYE